MELRGKFKVVAIKKKTSAKFFKDLKVGDVFELAYDINGGYESAPTIYIYQDGKRVHNNTALQLSNNLDKFELVEVSDIANMLSRAESLLSEAHDLMDNVHCYDTDIYHEISKYFYGEDE